LRRQLQDDCERGKIVAPEVQEVIRQTLQPIGLVIVLCSIFLQILFAIDLQGYRMKVPRYFVALSQVFWVVLSISGSIELWLIIVEIVAGLGLISNVLIYFYGKQKILLESKTKNLRDE
jgi:hypothetical protein